MANTTTGVLASCAEGDAGVGVEAPPVTLAFADSTATGTQTVIDFTGVTYEAEVEVQCS